MHPRHLVFVLSLLLLDVLSGVPSALAATPASTASGAEMGNAYADLTVFMLNVAAGNDGQPQQLQGEQTFKSAFAEQFALSYASLRPEDQQALAFLPALETQLHDAWPSLPVEQRHALRDQWAASVQDLVSGAPCDLFDAMARAQLLPSYGQYEQTNVLRLRQCWHDHPELTQGSEERASGQNYGAPGGGASGGSHATYMAMFNANMLSYTASMNIASMGTATYTVKSYP